MAELPNPIRDALRDGGSELGAQRVWARLAKTFEQPRRRWPVRAGFALAAIAALVLAAWALRPATRDAPGPLTIDGQTLNEQHLFALQHVPAELLLADGTRLRSVQPARVEVLENSAHVLSLFLHSGEVEFDIPPGGPRRWTIETGLVTVEVVGTKFNVARSENGVRVSVDRGVVLVRGERVPNRVRRLEHGQSFELAPPVEAVAPADDKTVRVVEVPVKRATRPPPVTKTPAVEVAIEAPDAGTAAEKSAEELFALADVARVSGRSQDAVSALARIIDAYPDDPMAPVAAFTLGKIQLEQLRDFASASASFERANELGLPDALREQAFARWVEALGRGGELARCREIAAKYRALFPNARYAEAERHCTP